MVFLLVSCREEKTVKKIDPITVEILSIGAEHKKANKAESFPGIIKPLKSTNLSFQVSGDIIKLAVNLGDFVKRGQVIASIDSSIYKEQYEASKAQVNLAKENYTRIYDVYKKGSIAEIRMIEAKSNFEQAQSAANAAYKNLGHTVIKAPFSGYVGDKLMEAGDVVSSGKAVVELIDISKVQAIISLSDQEVNNYKIGDKASVFIPVLEKEFLGVLTEIAVQSGKQNPVYSAKITIDNPEIVLKPGMTCLNYIERTSISEKIIESNFIKLPVDVVSITDEGENFVYIIDEQNNTAVRRMVEIGKIYDDGLAIKKGLNNGDKVIISGYHKLTSNTPVNIITN